MISEDHFRRYIKILERYSNTYTNGESSRYLAECRHYLTWFMKNKQYMNSKVKHYLLYNFLVRNLDLREDKEVKYKFNHIPNTILNNNFKLDTKKGYNFYKEEIKNNYKPSSLKKDKWIFKYLQLKKCSNYNIINNFKHTHLIYYENYDNIEEKAKFTLFLSNIFPSTYIITDKDKEYMTYLKSREVGIIYKRNDYKCTIDTQQDELNKVSFNSSRPFLKGLCNKYINKFQFMLNHNCLIHCKYYLDRIKCLRSKTVILFPYTFFNATTLSNGGLELFKPKSLIIINNVEWLIKSLATFFSFEISAEYCRNLNFKKESIKEDLQKLYNKFYYKVKTYEKQGWLNQIQKLKDKPLKGGFFPSISNSYKKESNEYLFRLLNKRGHTSIDGLNIEEYRKLCKLKRALYNIRLALDIPYQVRWLDKKIIFIPLDLKSLIERYIISYGSYFLLIDKNAKKYKPYF